MNCSSGHEECSFDNLSEKFHWNAENIFTHKPKKLIKFYPFFFSNCSCGLFHCSLDDSAESFFLEVQHFCLIPEKVFPKKPVFSTLFLWTGWKLFRLHWWNFTTPCPILSIGIWYFSDSLILDRNLKKQRMLANLSKIFRISHRYFIPLIRLQIP